MAATDDIKEIKDDVSDLRVGQANIQGDIKVLAAQHMHSQADSNTKHKQNRSDIHELYNGFQTLVDSVTTLRVRMAVYSAGAGLITGLLTTLAIELIKNWIGGKK
jgi:hypothetical protein